MQRRGGGNYFEDKIGLNSILSLLIRLLVIFFSLNLIQCQSESERTTLTLMPTAVYLSTTVSLHTITPASLEPPTETPSPQVNTAVPSPMPSPIPPTAEITVFPMATIPSIQTFQFGQPNLQMQELAQENGAQFVHVSSENSGIWGFPHGFVEHPIGSAKTDSHLFLLDRSRLIQISLFNPQNQIVLLAKDSFVEGVPVIELVDFAVAGGQLLVLDRAGDVFRYDLVEQSWSVDWYGRQLEDSSGHYYTAVSYLDNNAFLLESSYHFVQRYGAEPRIWPVPDALGVDIVEAEMTYVLLQSLETDVGSLNRYYDARYDPAFVSNVALRQVRKLAVTETAVYVLDWQGDRLVLFDKQGNLETIFQTPIGTTDFVIDKGQIAFVGPQGIIWYNQPQINKQIMSTLTEPLRSIHHFLSLPRDIFELPILGTALTERPLQMPGAPRHYRLGVHEGLDFYWRTGTPLYAVASGTIIRADLDYTRPSAADFEDWEAQTAHLGQTSESALNFYRGRQVWLEHENGLKTRYAHLSEIASDIDVGVRVERGQLIGAIGNSGSPASIDSVNRDAHLHLEIWYEDAYLGQYLRPVETWEIIKQIFEN